MARKSSVIGVAAVAALALAGCKYTASYTLNEDNTVDATLVFAAKLPDEAPPNAIIDEASEVDAIAAAYGHASVSPYEHPPFSGNQIVIIGEPLSSFQNPDDMWEIDVERVGSQYVITGMDISDLAAWNAQREAALSAGHTFSITVTFPGEVYEHNGSLSGRTVTWDLTNYTEPMYARGSAVPPPPPAPEPVHTVVITPSPAHNPAVTPAPSATSTPIVEPSAAPADNGDSIPAWIWAAGGGLLVVLAGLVGYIVANRGKASAAPAKDAEPEKPATSAKSDKAKDDAADKE